MTWIFSLSYAVIPSFLVSVLFIDPYSNLDTGDVEEEIITEEASYDIVYVPVHM